MKIYHTGLFVIGFILATLLIPSLPAAWAETGVHLVDEGVLLEPETAKQIATDLRDRKNLQELVAALKGELSARDVQIESLLGQIVALKEQNRQNEIAVAIAKAIDSIRIDQLDRYERTLGKAVERIDALEHRLTLSQIMGILGPLGMFLLLML